MLQVIINNEKCFCITYDNAVGALFALANNSLSTQFVFAPLPGSTLQITSQILTRTEELNNYFSSIYNL